MVGIYNMGNFINYSILNLSLSLLASYCILLTPYFNQPIHDPIYNHLRSFSISIPLEPLTRTW